MATDEQEPMRTSIENAIQRAPAVYHKLVCLMLKGRQQQAGCSGGMGKHVGGSGVDSSSSSVAISER